MRLFSRLFSTGHFRDRHQPPFMLPWPCKTWPQLASGHCVQLALQGGHYSLLLVPARDRPLAFHPEHTVYSHLPTTTGMDDLKTIAVSRLMLDNFPHIKAYWVTLTPPVAQIALRFGADDLDGTIIEERIIHGAGTPTSLGMTRASIEKLIRDA